MSSQEESAGLSKTNLHFTGRDLMATDEESRSIHRSFTRDQPQAVQDTQTHKPPPTAKVAPLVGGSSTGLLTPQRPLGHMTTPHENTPTGDSLRRKGNTTDAAVLSSSFSCVSLSSKEGRGASERSLAFKGHQHLMSKLAENKLMIEKQQSIINTLRQEAKQVNVGGGDTSVGLSDPVKLDILSRKLDKAHFELEKGKSERDQLQEKLSERESRITQLEGDTDTYKAKIKQLEEKVSKLEDYLGNTPTLEEHSSIKEQVTDLHSQNILLTERLKEKEDKIMSQMNELREKESALKEMSMSMSDLKQENNSLRLQCETSDRRLVELHSDVSQLKIELMKHKQQITELEAKSRQDLCDMRERHRLRFQEASAKLREQHRIVAKRNKQLELQLFKNSEVITTLNNEYKLSQGTVADLKSSVEDLVQQNQTLMEKNCGLHEPPEVGRSGIVSVSPVSDGSDESLQLLNQEVSQCVEEVDSLVSLASSLFEGKEPDMALLLGVAGGGGASCDKGEAELDPSKKYEQQLSQVQRNRKEIERLREKVTDHFASQVANECHLQ